jgi:hypothetical protein
VLPRLAAVLLLLAGARGCLSYEYEHEFWLRVDGSGSVRVTGQPLLWATFKNLRSVNVDDDTLKEAARLLFQASGLEVRRVTITRRKGRPYLFVAADFPDVNRIWGSPAFPDMRIHFSREGERLRLSGHWLRPQDSPDLPGVPRDGLVAVRFHLPSKVYEHSNAVEGVERGNIVAWRSTTELALQRQPLEFGALMDSRSILGSTVALFAAAIGVAAVIFGGALWLVLRRGRRAAA